MVRMSAEVVRMCSMCAGAFRYNPHDYDEIPDTLAPGTTIREAGLKRDGVLLTRHELAEFSLLESQRLSSSETTRFTSDD